MKRLARIRKEVVATLITSEEWNDPIARANLGSPQDPCRPAGHQSHAGRHLMRRALGRRRQIIKQLLDLTSREVE